MVNPGKRMNLLKAGAAVLPPEITRIHMDFALRWNDGHFGPKKFWKDCLPRLKYWNPSIPMIINRHTNQAGPAVMSIYFRQGGASPSKNMLPLAQQPHSSTKNETPAPAPEEGERIVTINMKNVHSDTILAEFLQKTGATLIEPTPEDRTQMVQIREREEKAAVDRAIMKKYMDNKRMEERILAQAKKEAEAIKLANS
ncbi:CI-B8 domain-containing protein [Xylariales sp. PMI_506]|nr:CI-B8 domain-containing protein [Xylariales sp. PMI_506]